MRLVKQKLAIQTHQERPLTETERFYWLSNQQHPFNMCIAVKFTGNCSLSLLRRGLDYIQQSHAFLNVAIRKDPHPQFVYADIPKIPIRVLVRKTEVDWQAEADDQLHHLFDYEKGPLMRVSYIQDGEEGGELLLIIDHLIADGVSCLHILEELFMAMDRISEGKRLYQAKISHINSLEQILEASGDQNSISRKPQPQGESIPEELLGKIGVATRSGFIHKIFSEQETSRLIQKCKQHGTTVQGALFAAVGLSMIETISTSYPGTTVPFKFHCPLNLRPYLSPFLNPQDLGCYIGLASFDMALSPSLNFWDLARKTKESLHFHISPDLPMHTRAQMCHIMNDCHTYADLSGRRKWTGLLGGVTNLGKIQISTYNKLKIESIHAFVALHGVFYNENNFYVAALTFKDQLAITFIYPKNLMNGIKARAVSDGIIQKLNLC